MKTTLEYLYFLNPVISQLSNNHGQMYSNKDKNNVADHTTKPNI
jgi:hypothetical protein